MNARLCQRRWPPYLGRYSGGDPTASQPPAQAVRERGKKTAAGTSSDSSFYSGILRMNVRELQVKKKNF